jgi:hypothetical protein
MELSHSNAADAALRQTPSPSNKTIFTTLLPLMLLLGCCCRLEVDGDNHNQKHWVCDNQMGSKRCQP